MSDNLEARLAKLEETVAGLVNTIEELTKTPEKVKKPAALEEFDILSNFVNDESWPVAVEPSLICDQNSDQDKADRADGILDLMIARPLKGTKILDFGCGEGHVAERALAQDCKVAVGFDIETQNWDKRLQNEKLILTTDWEVVKQNGPYNIVLLYDVVDHYQNKPATIYDRLMEIRSMLIQDGIIIVRCHPWTSRHGAHLYHKLNKAYLHLVFTEDELIKLGVIDGPIPVERIVHPLNTYRAIWQGAGLRVENEHVIQENVEPFFERTPWVANRIKKQWAKSGDDALRLGHTFPGFQMSQQFVDYRLIR